MVSVSVVIVVVVAVVHCGRHAGVNGSLTVGHGARGAGPLVHFQREPELVNLDPELSVVRVVFPRLLLLLVAAGLKWALVSHFFIEFLFISPLFVL